MHSSNKADASPQTDELRAAAFRRYLGYYGPFVVDDSGGTVTHIVEGSSNPSWVGTKQLRYYELSADNAQLTLSLRDGARTTAVARLEALTPLGLPVGSKDSSSSNSSTVHFVHKFNVQRSPVNPLNTEPNEPLNTLNR